MKSNNGRPFSTLNRNEWMNLLYFVFITFYFILSFSDIVNGAIGNDYLQYWFAGKIADEKGYSEIYKPSELSITQHKIIVGSGSMEHEVTFPPLPLGYFSIFILPFQFLSRFPIERGYLIWIVLNLILLIIYLDFFLRKIFPYDKAGIPGFKFLIPFISSYAVYFNIICGQVEVFILICAGEFIRKAGNNKPFLSGLWLGGLLLKPPLLILIIPIIIILRYWKVMLGLITSSVIILGTSLLLSGLDGMRDLINIWTSVTGATAPTGPEIMINWRMIGVNWNALFNSSLGWAIVALGISFTLMAVIYLVRHTPSFGTPLWVMTMLGIFSATLAVTWHSHYHMAMILIPFLIYALVQKTLPENRIVIWGIVTPVVLIGIVLFEIFSSVNGGIRSMNLYQRVIAFTGFLVNIVIFISVLQTVKSRNLFNQ